jgi:hypothetical protein
MYVLHGPRHLEYILIAYSACGIADGEEAKKRRCLILGPGIRSLPGAFTERRVSSSGKDGIMVELIRLKVRVPRLIRLFDTAASLFHRILFLRFLSMSR